MPHNKKFAFLVRRQTPPGTFSFKLAHDRLMGRGNRMNKALRKAFASRQTRWGRYGGVTGMKSPALVRVGKSCHKGLSGYY